MHFAGADLNRKQKMHLRGLTQTGWIHISPDRFLSSWRQWQTLISLLHAKLFLSFSQSDFVTAQGVGRSSNILNYLCMEAVKGLVVYVIDMDWYYLYRLICYLLYDKCRRYVANVWLFLTRGLCIYYRTLYYYILKRILNFLHFYCALNLFVCLRCMICLY